MKTLKAICAASILALALGVPVSAGDIGSPGCPTPVPGDIHTPGTATAAPGEIGSPGFTDLLWAAIAMF
jgi:hypothetical protein